MMMMYKRKWVESKTNLDPSQLSSLASIDMPIVQPQGDQLLQAGVDLLMHRRVLRRDLGQLLKQPRPAVKVVALCVLQTLAVVCRCLLCRLERVALRLCRPCALHRLVTRGAQHSLLAGCSCVLLLRCRRCRGIYGGRLWRARSLRGCIVVNSTHVVEEIPATWESVSRY